MYKLIVLSLVFVSCKLSLAQVELPIVLQNKNIKSINIFSIKDSAAILEAHISISKKGHLEAVEHGNYSSNYFYKKRKLQYIETQYRHPTDSRKNFYYQKYYKGVDSVTIIDSTIMNRPEYSDTIVRTNHSSVINQIPYLSSHFKLSNKELIQSYLVDRADLYEVKIDSVGFLHSASFEGETFATGCVVWTEVHQSFFSFNGKGYLMSSSTKTSGLDTGNTQYNYDDSGLLVSWTSIDMEKQFKKYEVKYIYYK